MGGLFCLVFGILLRWLRRNRFKSFLFLGNFSELLNLNVKKICLEQTLYIKFKSFTIRNDKSIGFLLALSYINLDTTIG